MYVDGGSNVMLVASPSLLHNLIQTNNKVCNTGGDASKNTHTGYLYMLLATHNKTLLLIMKHAYFMPSNSHNTFGLSPFLIHGRKRETNIVYERVNVDVDHSSNMKIPITMIRFFRSY